MALNLRIIQHFPKFVLSAVADTLGEYDHDRTYFFDVQNDMLRVRKFLLHGHELDALHQVIEKLKQFKLN